MMKKISKSGFTIMEIIIVVIILGVVAGFSLPNLSKAQERTHAQEAVMHLKNIHSANQVFLAKNDEFWPPDNASYDTASIKLNLNVVVFENGMTYACTGTNGTTFTCTATRNGPATSFTMRITEDRIDGSNPCCSAGVCPYLSCGG